MGVSELGQVLMSRSPLQNVEAFLFLQKNSFAATYNLTAVIEAISMTNMALPKKPNDYLIGKLLARQAESSQHLESLLWAFARQNYSVLNSGIVESFTNRIGELRYEIIEAYRSHTFDIRTFVLLPSRNQKNYKIKLKDWGFMSDHPTNARRALTYLDANRRLRKSVPFPFLQLPFEIRQLVYSYMLAGTGRQVKIFDGAGNHEYLPWKKTHMLSAKHLLPFSSPEFENYNQGELEIDAAILRTCHQIHDEAEPKLYRLHDFGFGTNTPSIVSFLQTVSHQARRNIRCIGMAFVAWSHVEGSLDRLMMQDYQNWSFACSYIAENLALHELVFDLDIPVQLFRFEQWDGIEDLLKITGLKRLTQQPLYAERSVQGHRAIIDGVVGSIREQEWLRSMTGLLIFLVDRMVRKDCYPQKKPQWQQAGY